jgi:hypothetical protein
MAIGDPLAGDNIFDHMRHCYDLCDRRDHYFRVKSQLWKAIVEHIWHSKQVVLAPKPTEDCFVITHPGTGPAISIRDVGCYAKDYQEEHKDGKFQGYKGREVAFWIKFEVTWHSDDYGEEVERKYELTLPCDLELNFTKAKFDAFVKEFAEQRAAETVTHKLDELVDKLPECAERNKITSELSKIRSKYRVKIDPVDG